jgi:hypothetical protein
MTQTLPQYGLGEKRAKKHVSRFDSCQNQQLASWIASRQPRVMSRTHADAIAILTVDECDRFVEWRPARPNVTHRDVLVPNRHATEEDEPVRG